MKKEPPKCSSMIWIVSLQNDEMPYWKCLGVLVQERKQPVKPRKYKKVILKSFHLFLNSLDVHKVQR